MMLSNLDSSFFSRSHMEKKKRKSLMKDDQIKGEGLRSDDGDDDHLSFLLGLVFFSMVMVVVIISLSSVWV